VTPKVRPPAGNREAQTTSVGRVVDDIVAANNSAQTPEIARGTAGDCCIWCGKVGIHLPLDHGCRPNIDVEAYRAQPKRAAEFLDGR
jgi:hypothetical protein